jgi:hypothetical protein
MLTITITIITTTIVIVVIIIVTTTITTTTTTIILATIQSFRSILILFCINFFKKYV